MSNAIRLTGNNPELKYIFTGYKDNSIFTWIFALMSVSHISLSNLPISELANRRSQTTEHYYGNTKRTLSKQQQTQ